MDRTDAVGSRQMAAAAFVALLSPCIRRFPRALALYAGRSAYLAPLLAFLPVGAGLLLAHLALRRLRDVTDLGGLFRRAAGERAGRALELLYALWLTLYAGFLLRAGADRFITTVYPGAGPWVFALTMAAVCLPAVAGPWRAVGRTAALLRPLLLAIPALLVLLALKDLRPELLLPVERADLLPNLRGALELANGLSAAVYLTVLAGEAGPLRLRDFALWGGVLLALLAALTAACLAMLGPELTARMLHPFFMLVRDVSVLGALERVEPLVIGLWVFSDFVLISALLSAAVRCLRSGLALPPAGEGLRRCGLPPYLCAAVAAAAAIRAIPDLRVFEALNELWMPRANALFAVFLPACALVVALVKENVVKRDGSA